MCPVATHGHLTSLYIVLQVLVASSVLDPIPAGKAGLFFFLPSQRERLVICLSFKQYLRDFESLCSNLTL
jgi:hypothetical protein